MEYPTLTTSPLTNLRDLGGIPVTGGAVRPGVLLRSDDASFVDERGARALVDDGLALVIDLRSPQETQFTGRGVLGDLPVEYLHLPLTQDVAGPSASMAHDMLALADDPEDAMGIWYAGLLRDQAPRVIRGLRRIAGQTGATLFHCAAGKDRTGVFAAAILSVLGADSAHIVADYTRTGDVLPALLARLDRSMRPLLGDILSTREVPPVMLSAPAAAMSSMLDVVAREDGGVVEVLRRAGLDESLEAALRKRLVEPV